MTEIQRSKTDEQTDQYVALLKYWSFLLMCVGVSAALIVLAVTIPINLREYMVIKEAMDQGYEQKHVTYERTDGNSGRLQTYEKTIWVKAESKK